MTTTTPELIAETVAQPTRARAKWQRSGGWLLVAGGTSLAAKFLLLAAYHPKPIPRFVIAPGASVLITVGLVFSYCGSSALVVPLLRRRPTWMLSLAAPVAVVGCILFAGVIGGIGDAMTRSATSSVLHDETGLLLFGLVSIAVGSLLVRGAGRHH